jgi:hypothetical protein
MRTYPAIALVVGAVFVGAAHAQQSSSSQDKRSSIELTGCISNSPGSSGAFTFTDSKSGSAYRLTGKGVRKFAGQMVRLVGGPQGKRLSIRGGLWPSPNAAGQAGGTDAAQDSIARQPGGAGSGTGGNELPEFYVMSVRGLEGACK